MRYTTLSEIDTEVWLSNINKTLILLKKMLSTSNALETNIKQSIIEKYHRTIYLKLYHQLFYGLYDINDIIIAKSSGKCYSFNGLFSDLSFSLSQDEMEIIRETDILIDNGDMNFIVEISECWAEYADRPFEIEESDVLKYNNILKIHSTCKDLLQTIGAYDEALDVVKDSRSRS